MKKLFVLILFCVQIINCERQFSTKPKQDEDCTIHKNAMALKIINEIPLFELEIKNGIVCTGYDSLDMLNKKYYAKDFELVSKNKTNESSLNNS